MRPQLFVAAERSRRLLGIGNCQHFCWAGRDPRSATIAWSACPRGHPTTTRRDWVATATKCRQWRYRCMLTPMRRWIFGGAPFKAVTW